jgi:hypothetical protein
MSSFERYSAVGIFGVPMDNPEILLVPGGQGIIDLMGQYGVDPQPLAEDITDITPYYATNLQFSYFLHYSKAANLATVELMPRNDRAIVKELYEVTSEAKLDESDIRTVRIETPKDMFALIKASPRFGSMPCIHELITCQE